MTSRYH